MRAQSKKPIWINDQRIKQGYVQVDDKRYTVGGSYAEDEDAERNVLGCILVAGELGNSRAAMQRIGQLHYDDFFWRRNGIIFRAVERIYQRGNEVDLSTLLAELRKQQVDGQSLLDYVGGEVYLRQLTTVLVDNIQTYAYRVLAAALRRSMKFAAQMIDRLSDNHSLELIDMAHQAQQAVQDVNIRIHAMNDQGTFNLYDAIEEFADQVIRESEDENYESGIPTGFTWLDHATLGSRKQKLYILAAPPGWGKSAWLLSMALNVLRQGKRVLYLLLADLSKEDVMTRILANEASIDSLDIESRNLKLYQQEAVKNASGRLKAMNLSRAFQVVPLRMPTIDDIRLTLARHQLDPGFDLVIIDYVLSLTISDGGRFKGDERAHTAHIFAQLDDMKREFDVPIWVATQMNRDWDARKGKHPNLNDLYMSSAIGFVADFVGFIYQPTEVDEMTDYPDRAEFIPRKNRAGRKGVALKPIYMKWEPQFTRFSDWHLPPEDL